MGQSDVTQTPADGTSTGAGAAAVEDVIRALREIAAGQERVDLLARLDETAWKVARTEMLVCVVGEFKKGKSALINALLGQDVCPVDDDLATAAVTLVRHDDEPTVTVRRREDGELVVEEVPPEEAAHWVVEHDQAASRRSVELVEIGLPHPLLARGIALVDTPGVGGLNAAHATATLAFLPSADALVFVTDASAELSGPELDFLARAQDAGPPILFAVTKVDMYPEWRRIVELDGSHLTDAGIHLQALPVSSMLHAAAEHAGDGELLRDSGLPQLREAIITNATDGARGAAVASALRELTSAIEQLREPVETEIDALERPERVKEISAELEEVRSRLGTLDDADASWSLRVADEFEGLRSNVTFGFQQNLRQLLRNTHDEVERIDPSKSWSDLGQRLQNDVASNVRTAFLAVTDGAARIQTTVAEMLADAEADFADSSPDVRYEVTDAWRGGPEFGGKTQTGMLTTMGLLGGAAVGVEMLGVLGMFAGAAIVGPAAIGVALVFGGKQVVDERRRQLEDRRQQARSFVSDFIEDVQFEVEGRLATMLADLQRQMRARFAERIRQLQRTNEEAVEALERSLEQNTIEREARLEELRAEQRLFEELQARVVHVSGRAEPSLDRQPSDPRFGDAAD